MSDKKPLDEKVHKELKDKRKETPEEFRDRMGLKGQQLLVLSQEYKQRRMDTLSLYERLYNNDVPPKLRQMFNVVLPIFSGMIDELLAMFNDQIQIKFNATNPAQHLVVPKIQAQWNTERDSLSPNARWNYKGRVDRFNAVLSGRGIFKEFAYNDPEYKNVLQVINYSDFHCQPLGGGNLDNHLFKGTEGNFRTKYELKTNSKYDQDQVKKLVEYGWSDTYFQQLETTYGTKFARWWALGLDVENNTFAGDFTYNLCEFIIQEDGVDYEVVFEPCSSICLYCKPWTETMPSGNSPFKSYATHPDDKNFWSKSYADDLFRIADAVITMFNQELTNREKKNFNSRAIDKDMFTDIAKFDAAQYRPDTIVPADTAGGTKKISEGVYAFETAELKGTIDLIDWISTYTGQKTGADELPPPQKGAGQSKASIMIAQQQKQSKRVGLKSDEWKECYAQLGTIFVEGMKEFMPPKMSIQVIGENGFIEEQELRRIEVRNCGIIGISVTSTTEQESSDAMKKDARIQSINMVTANPNLTKYEKETIYRDIGQFDETEITFLLDTQGATSRKQIAHCSQAIQDILLKKKPDIYYGADISYLTYFKQYIIDHKSQIKGKEKAFGSFLQIISPIIQKNMQDAAKNAPPQPQTGPDGKPVQPQQGQQSAQPKPALSIPAQAQKMGKVASA